jgi:hypothetical protein
VRGRSPSLLPVPGYSMGEALEARLDRLRQSGVEQVEIGRSREGRPLRGFIWRSPEAGSGDPVGPSIFLLSLLHPMEWIGLEANLALLEGWAEPRPGLYNLPPNAVVFSVPMANPDGCARVCDALHRGQPRWVRGNAAGIDLNRNFPVGFRPRSNRLAFWPLYRPGPAPLSEPETAAVAAWVGSREIHLGLSFHSFGRKIFYPPAFQYRSGTGSRPHREGLQDALAPAGLEAGAALDQDSASAYSVQQLGRWLPVFRARGTEIDFLHAATGSLAYLVELSVGGFGRWGRRRLGHPFFLFNPPRPEEELGRVLPILRRLAETAAHRWRAPAGGREE